MPSLTQLKYIVAVDEHRHFGLASKAENVSQPSLSQQIQKAEDELGVVIFDRSTKPIRVTERGEKIIRQARLILSEHQHLLEIGLQKDSGLSGQLKLAVIPTLSAYLVPLFLSSFAESYPFIRLEISELQTETIIKGLHEERLDAALLATPLHEKGLTEEPLFYEPFLIYHSPGHPAFKKQNLSLKDIKDEKAWVLADGHCFGDQMLTYCSLNRNNPVFPNVQFQSGSFETLQGLVDGSKSYTLFPQLFVDRLPKSLQARQIKSFKAPAPSREISLVFKRKVWKQDLLEALQTNILEHLPKTLPKKPKKMEVLELTSL
jgi:LysR family hydrogen peroxide-inducible transcriptional activator